MWSGGDWWLDRIWSGGGLICDGSRLWFGDVLAAVAGDDLGGFLGGESSGTVADFSPGSSFGSLAFASGLGLPVSLGAESTTDWIYRIAWCSGERLGVFVGI